MSEPAQPIFPVVQGPDGAPDWMAKRPPAIRRMALPTRDAGAPMPSARPPAAPPTPTSPPAAARELLAQVEAEIRAEVDRELDAAKAALTMEQSKLTEERAGLEAERAALQEQQRQFAEAVGALSETRASLREEVTEPLLELAVGIAEALVERAIEREPELHRALAQAALDALGGAADAELRVSRATYEAIVEHHGEARIRHGASTVPLVVDASIEGLGAVAVQGWTRVDGRLRERLRGALEAMLHERRLEGPA